jgi:hypothetical protein
MQLCLNLFPPAVRACFLRHFIFRKLEPFRNIQPGIEGINGKGLEKTAPPPTKPEKAKVNNRSR